MMRTRMRRISVLASVVLCMLGATVVNAESPALTSARLVEMSWEELDQIYRQAQPGPIPEGYLRGHAIYCPCSKHAGLRSSVNSLQLMVAIPLDVRRTFGYQKKP